MSNARNIDNTSYDQVVTSVSGVIYPDYILVNEHKAKKSGFNNEGLFCAVVTLDDALAIQHLSNVAEDYVFNIVKPGELSGSNFTRNLSGTLNEESVSYDFAKQYPPLTNYELSGSTYIAPEYDNVVTLVVAETIRNSSDSGKLNIKILETHTGSVVQGTTQDGGLQHKQTWYIGDIINRDSNYVKLYKTDLAAPDITVQQFSTELIPDNIQLLSFNKSECLKQINLNEIPNKIKIALDKVSNINEYQIDIVVDAGLSTIASTLGPGDSESYELEINSNVSNESFDRTKWKNIIEIYREFCEKTRGDCITIVDVPRQLSIDGSEKIIRKTNDKTISADIISNLRYISVTQSSYLALYFNWIKINDRPSGIDFWAPPSSRVAGIFVRHDKNGLLENPPAGYPIGVVRNVNDISVNFDKKEAALVYEQNINFLRKYDNGDIVIEGQKTYLRNGIFNRIQQRRLMCRLKRYTYEVLKYFVFESNNIFTRRRIITFIEKLLTAIKRENGLYDYKIVCDETNNVPAVIDRGELILQIGLKFTKNAEFIIIDFVATDTAGSFSE